MFIVIIIKMKFCINIITCNPKPTAINCKNFIFKVFNSSRCI